MLKLDLTLYKLYTNQKVNSFLFLLTSIVLFGFFITFPFDMLFIAFIICICTLLFGSVIFLSKAVRVAYLKLLST